MAVLQYLGQVPAQWFDASGNAALSGGKLQFFEVGTTTPKAVYSDYQGLASAGTTVTLDSSGRANIWLAGIYSVQLLTAADVPIGNRIDGIGQELAPDVNASAVLSVETYDDLRALTGANVRICGVEGRAANGDGGAGMFAWDDSETAVDDGGTILTPGTNPASGRWVRIFSGDMDFRWFGDITGTDDTTAYALGLAASVARERFLSIANGVVRLTSSVSAPTGAQVRILLGGQIVAASSLVGLGFPAGTVFDGSPGCFGENIAVSFGLNAVPAVDVTWWDVANDDTRLAAASNACSAANMEVIIPRAMGLEMNYSQPANSVLSFRGPGKLAWSGAGAVTVVLRRWNSDSPVFPRFTFSTVAKLASLTMVESQREHLSPMLFGAVGDGTVDDAAAVWPVVLHGWGWIDRRYLVGTSMVRSGSAYFRGPLDSARDITASADIPHGIKLGSGINFETSADLVVSGTGIYALNAVQSAITVGGRFVLSKGFLWGQLNAGIASLGLTSMGNEISESKLDTAPVHGAGILRDSDVYGVGTFDVDAIPQIGLGAAGWEISRSYVEKIASIGITRLDNSELPSVDTIAWADGAISTASTVTPTNSTSSKSITGGAFQLIGGNFTMPIVGSDGHAIAISALSGASLPQCNGYGSISIHGTTSVYDEFSGANAIRLAAEVLEGVQSPTVRSSSMGNIEVPTASTSNWVFGTSATPTVAVDEFQWSGGGLSASPATIDKTITTDAEKILCAYGGVITVEWTGDASAVTLLAGDESVSALKCPGSGWNKAVFPIWPGVVTATTSYSIRITHGGGSVSMRVTVQPCAPIDRRQWEIFWGGDRTLSASRYNSWKDTLDQDGNCDMLDCWIDTLPMFPYTPRPQTVQPWLATLAAPVHLFPRNGTVDISTLLPNPISSIKPSASSTFFVYRVQAS